MKRPALLICILGVVFAFVLAGSFALAGMQEKRAQQSSTMKTVVEKAENAVPVQNLLREEEISALQSAKPRQTNPLVIQLEQEAMEAKERGDVNRVRELNGQLEMLYSSQQPSVEQTEVEIPQPTPPDIQSWIPPLQVAWGNDVLVSSGDFLGLGFRELATASDTVGNVYVAGNFYTGTASQLRVYKSTNNGLSWSLVSGFYYNSGYIIQSISMNVTDTSGGRWLIGCLWVVKTSTSDPGGSLVWGSFLDNGSNWRVSSVLSSTASTQYRNATITSDGYLWPPSLTYHYGAAERITPSTGISRGITAVRSTNMGKIWGSDSTASYFYEDGYPTIGVSYDSVYISLERRWSTTDRDIRMVANNINYSGSWRLFGLTSRTDDEYGAYLATSTIDASLIVTYTLNYNNSGDLDARYIYSTNRGITLTDTYISNSSYHNEFFTSANYVYDNENEWRVAYKNGNDSVMYKSSVTISGLGAGSPTFANQYSPTGVMIPVVGSHREGTGGYYGHVIYAGYGPTNLYYDGSDIAVSVTEKHSLPSSYSLYQNFPNPFNPTTDIEFSLPKESNVRIIIYDLLGREINILVDERIQAGVHRTTWNPMTQSSHAISSGVYYYRLTATPLDGSEQFVQTRKMILLK